MFSILLRNGMQFETYQLFLEISAQSYDIQLTVSSIDYAQERTTLLERQILFKFIKQ